MLASGRGREALIIDPVGEHAEDYLRLIADLDLKLLQQGFALLTAAAAIAVAARALMA